MLTLEKICKVAREIAPLYEINEIYLFGSYARGDSTEESDCDFRIVGGNMRTLFQLGRLNVDFEDALGKPIDLVITEDMTKEFHELIKNEEVLIYAQI